MRNKTFPAVFLTAVLGMAAALFMTVEELQVAAPGFAAFVLVLWLWLKLWDRDQKFPLFDVGAICALATLFYTAYPLLNYWVQGLEFGFLSDARLQSYNIAPHELGFFHMRPVLYLFSFVSAYSVFRGSGTIETGNVEPANRSTRQVVLLFVLLVTGYFFLLELTTGINLNPSYEGGSRATQVAALESVPTVVRQISVKLAGVLFVFKLALLAIVISRCRQKKWLAILVLWIGAEILQVVLILGARSGLILLLMAAALLYHRLIKPFSMKLMVASGMALFIVFVSLGLLRDAGDMSTLQMNLSESRAGIFAGSNEFQALLGTSYDVLQRKEAGAYLPWYLYVNDVIMILPPQQLLPFEKVDASEWYLREIGLSGTGEGYMWGVISQSIVGFDWLELALRGAALGYILARFHRWYLKHQTGFLETLLYVLFCITVYYTFRSTTLSFLANFVWEWIPFYMILRIWADIPGRTLRAKVGDSHALPVHSPA